VARINPGEIMVLFATISTTYLLLGLAILKIYQQTLSALKINRKLSKTDIFTVVAGWPTITLALGLLLMVVVFSKLINKVKYR
jgi:hypothetical protein